MPLATSTRPRLSTPQHKAPATPQQQAQTLQQQQMDVMKQIQQGSLAPTKGIAQLQALGGGAGTTPAPPSGGSGFSAKDSFDSAPTSKPPVQFSPAPVPIAVGGDKGKNHDHDYLKESGGGSKLGLGAGSN